MSTARDEAIVSITMTIVISILCLHVLPFSIKCHNNKMPFIAMGMACIKHNMMVLEFLVHLRTGSTHFLHRNKYKFCDISPHPQSVCEKRASAARMQKIQLPSSLPIPIDDANLCKSYHHNHNFQTKTSN